MWVQVSYNRIFYQDGRWKEDHFLELDNGMLLCYEVANKTPSGRLARVTAMSSDQLELKLDFENEHGEKRTVTLLCGSIRSRNLFMHHLNKIRESPGDGASDQVVFETVVIKYPTEGNSSNAAAAVTTQQQQRRDSKRKDSIVTSKLDDLTSFMGSAQRRLFKLFADGSLAYFEVSPVACVSVSHSSSLLCVLESPQEYISSPAGTRTPIFAVTCMSASHDASLPQPPPSTSTNPLRILTRKLFSASNNGSGTSLTAEEAKSVAPTTANNLASCITFGTTRGAHVCDDWLSQIQSYSAWFHHEFAKDSLDRKRAKVLLKGWCWKRGVFTVLKYKPWKLRFLLVLSNREIVYYDAELGGTELGAISLAKMKSIRIGNRAGDKPQGFSDFLQLETVGRTWYLSPQARNRGEQAVLLQKWISCIQSLASEEDDASPAAAKDVEEKSLRPKRSSLLSPAAGYSPDAFFVSPQALTTDTSSATMEELPSVPIIRLSGWERLSGNMPSAMLSPSPHKDALLLWGSGLLSPTNAQPDEGAGEDGEEDDDD